MKKEIYIANLSKLLTKSEIEKIENTVFFGGKIDLYKEIKFLTIEDLSRIGLTLIETEYNGSVPQCVISAEAINILTKRAKEKELGIF
jgi:hypothetical protein